MKRIITAAMFSLALLTFGMADPTAAPSLPAVTVIRLAADPQKGFEANRGKEVGVNSANATEFRVLPGLKDPSMVSLEAIGYPGAYVRHKNAVIWLHERPKKKDLVFDGNASFRLIHLEGDKVRFEASGLADRFIAVRDDGSVILARNPSPEQSTFVFAAVEVAAAKVSAAPAAPQSVAAPAAPGNGASPSSQIEPLLEPSLNAILAPLAENPPMPRVPVEKLRASLGAGAVKAKTPAQKQIYQYAMAVCEALTNGMDDRAQAKTTASASAQVPSLSAGAGIAKTMPLRGRDAGADAEAIRRQEKDERNYLDKQAKSFSNFTDTSASKTWASRAAVLRENVMGLYGKLVQLEAAEPANEAAAAPPPAAK